MLTLRADGLTLEVPSSWDEVSLSQFFSYTETETDIEMLSVLSGVPLAELRPNKVADLSQVLTLLTWREDIPTFNRVPAPIRLELNGRTIKPMKLGRYTTVGQQWDVEAEMDHMNAQQQPVNYITMARVVLSIYLYPAVTGKPYQTIEEAYSILPLIDALPVTQALPLAHIAFESFLHPKPSGKVHVTQVPTPAASHWTKVKYIAWCLRFDWQALGHLK